MGYFVGLPSELDVVKAGVDYLMDDDDYDVVREEDLGEDFDIEEYRQRDDVDVVEEGTRDGETVVALEPQSDEAREMLEPGTPISVGSPAANGGSNPNVSANGGENNMTDDSDAEPVPVAYDGSHADHAYGEFEVNVRQSGGQEYVENPDEYGEFDEAPIEELGVANYIEAVVNGEVDDLDLEDDVAQYVAEKDDFDYGEMIRAKADMGGKDFEEFLSGVDRVVGEVNELTDDLEATAAIYQALNEEKQADIDSYNNALQNIGEMLQEVRRESEYLENVADLNGAAADERQAQQDFEDAEQTFRNL